MTMIIYDICFNGCFFHSDLV